MPRAKRGFKARQRRNRWLKHAKGFYSARQRQFSDAVEQVRNAWQDAYAARRAKKRDFRRLWIVRINAALRTLGFSYSRFINAVNKANVQVDRKVLADLAVNDPQGFKALVDAVRG